MCLAKAYIGEVESGEMVLEDISRMRIDGDKIYLATLFGERKEIEGVVKEVDFQGSRIVIQSAR